MSNEEKSFTYRALWGILIIGILSLVAVTKGLNGEITKYAIGGIVVLAIGEKAIDYYFNKKI